MFQLGAEIEWCTADVAVYLGAMKLGPFGSIMEIFLNPVQKLAKRHSGDA